MTSDDLETEMRAAVAALSTLHVRELMAAGVTPGLLVAGMVGVTRVTVRGKLYEPDPEGRLAYLTAIRAESGWTIESSDPVGYAQFGEPVDLVAWRPGAAKWALRCGNVTVLGLIEPQYLDPFPVRLRRSPLAWLRARCDGLVLLTDDPVEARVALGLCAGLVAEDRQHATMLHRLLSRPAPHPPITVAAEGRRAA